MCNQQSVNDRAYMYYHEVHFEREKLGTSEKSSKPEVRPDYFAVETAEIFYVVKDDILKQSEILHYENYRKKTLFCMNEHVLSG